MSIGSEIIDRARRHGIRTAVVEEDGSDVSYTEVVAKSEKIADALNDAGLLTGDLVGLLVEKSASAICAMLAVSAGGGVYVPLDVASPATRLRSMLSICRPWAIIVEAEKVALAHEVIGDLRIRIIVLRMQDRRPLRIVKGGDDHVSSPLAPDIAYVLFTSGSTGAPKAVPIQHASALHIVEWCNRTFGIDGEDRVSSHAPLHFDTSVWDIFGALWAGAELHLVPKSVNPFPARLAKFMRDRALTRWASVPSALFGLMNQDELEDSDLPALRSLCWYGEPMPLPLLRYLMRRLGHVRFANLYGPTEAAVFCTYFPLTDAPEDNNSVPIGWSIEDKPIHVVGEDGRGCAPGTPGELVVGGPYLSPGYLGRDDLTANAFVEWPEGSGKTVYRTGDVAVMEAHGRLRLLGRRDRQIKRLGIRIELDEIVRHIEQLPGISACAVVAIPEERTGNLICAACEIGEADPPSTIDLRRMLSEKLPSYMIPTHWKFLPKLPINRSDKIDNVATKRLFMEELSDGNQKHD